MTKHIEEKWRDFEGIVGLKDAPAMQRIEMRRAFYAGFEAFRRILFEHLTDTGHPDDYTDDDDRLMRELDDELRAFAADLARGVA